MKTIKTYLLILTMLFCCSSCAKSCKSEPAIAQQTSVDTIVIIETHPEQAKYPDWVVIDTSFIPGYTTLSSANMKLDTNSAYSVFPFVVVDSQGNKELFFMVSLKRYDMLYVNQLAIYAGNERFASMGFVEKTCIRDNFESVLFMLQPAERALLQQFDSDELAFCSWGLLGSTMWQLNEEQSANLMYMVKITK